MGIIIANWKKGTIKPHTCSEHTTTANTLVDKTDETRHRPLISFR